MVAFGRAPVNGPGSLFKDALYIDADASSERLAQAVDMLATGNGVVVFERLVALTRERECLKCEVIDPDGFMRRCAHEYEVLVENSRRALDRSELRRLLPDWPQRWSVVEDRTTGVREVWHAP